MPEIKCKYDIMQPLMNNRGKYHICLENDFDALCNSNLSIEFEKVGSSIIDITDKYVICNEVFPITGSILTTKYLKYFSVKNA